MIETKEQYEKLRHDLEWLADAGLPDRRDLVETIEALKELAIAVNGVLYGSIIDMGKWKVREKLDALPDWTKEQEI